MNSYSTKIKNRDIPRYFQSSETDNIDMESDVYMSCLNLIVKIPREMVNMAQIPAIADPRNNERCHYITRNINEM